MTYKPKEGDRVRVVLEGTVSSRPLVSGSDFYLGIGSGVIYIDPCHSYVVSVEKLQDRSRDDFMEEEGT